MFVSCRGLSVSQQEQYSSVQFTRLKSHFLAMYSNEAGYFLMTVYGSFIPVSNVTGFGADMAV